MKRKKKKEAEQEKRIIPLEERNLSNNFLFAKTMEDKEVCRQVLEEILQIKIKTVRNPTTEKTINIDDIAKGVRLDVFVEDENNTAFNIEMQLTNNDNLGKRARYYQGAIDLELIQKGEQYKSLNKTFIIFICTFDSHERGRSMYTFNHTCKEEPNLLLNDDSTIIFLNTKSPLNDVSDDLKGFLKYVECSTDEVVEEYDSPLVRMVAKRVAKVKENKEIRRQYMTLERYLEERAEEERLEGRIEGRLEEKIAIARNLLKLLDNETISEMTGLSIEQVRELRVEKNKV